MDKTRQQIVKEFVLAVFDGKTQTPVLSSITREEIHAVVLTCLLEHGSFPRHACMTDGSPPIYFGEQIRRLNSETYIVANVDFFAYSSPNESSIRTFSDAFDAVSCFVRATIGNRMAGIPVI